MIVTANTLFPPIGALAMARVPDRLSTVFRVVAIRGRVPTRTGALVAPAPIITIENVKTKERQHMPLPIFHNTYRWEYAQ